MIFDQIWRGNEGLVSPCEFEVLELIARGCKNLQSDILQRMKLG